MPSANISARPGSSDREKLDRAGGDESLRRLRPELLDHGDDREGSTRLSIFDTTACWMPSHNDKIRLSVIDVPELGQPHGRAARRALLEMIQGRDLRVVVTTRGRYGRVVARGSVVVPNAVGATMPAVSVEPATDRVGRCRASSQGCSSQTPLPSDPEQSEVQRPGLSR